MILNTTVALGLHFAGIGVYPAAVVATEGSELSQLVGTDPEDMGANYPNGGQQNIAVVIGALVGVVSARKWLH